MALKKTMMQTSLDRSVTPEEFLELTKRSAEWLPYIDPLLCQNLEIPGERLLTVQFHAFLENKQFDAMYETDIYIGDFGLYRIGEIRTYLIPINNLGNRH